MLMTAPSCEGSKKYSIFNETALQQVKSLNVQTSSYCLQAQPRFYKFRISYYDH